MDRDSLLRAAAAGGWSEADLRWEQLQEAAAEQSRSGELEQAARLWAEALVLAREAFVKQDPRLATSLANHAGMLRRKGDADSAAALFREALLVWDSSGPWIESLNLQGTARSSLFHLRMENRHRAQYQASARQRLKQLAQNARGLVAARAAGESEAADLYGRWKGERPPMFNDARKLLGAVFLIAPQIT